MTEKTTCPYCPHRSFDRGRYSVARGGAALFFMAALVFGYLSALPGAGLAGEGTRKFNYTWDVSVEVPEVDNATIANGVRENFPSAMASPA